MRKAFQPRTVLGYISRQRRDGAAGTVCTGVGHSRRLAHGANCKIYREYVCRLREANALDFDDIILHAVTLLQQFDEVRHYYQRKFRYVLIDEYQDTNNLRISSPRSWLGNGAISASWETTTRVFTASAAPISKISSALKRIIPRPGSSGWSRIIAPPGRFWRRPMQ